MTRPQYAILKNKTVVPVSMEEWAQWFEPKSKDDFQEKRVVAQDFPQKDIKVSTVFLGINHGFFGPPLWFETMIFGGEYDGYQERYETWEQAEAGHREALELATTKKEPHPGAKHSCL